jgi:hypothetical protein
VTISSKRRDQKPRRERCEIYRPGCC